MQASETRRHARALSGEYTGVLQASSHDDLLSEVLRFTRWLGFDRVTATAVVDSPDGDAHFFAVDNAPPAYRPIHDDVETGRVSPVASFCKRANVPIVWDQSTYVSAGQGPRWELQAPFGYRTGIAYAMHLPHGLHFLFGVDRVERLPACAREVSHMVAALQLFACHAADVALRILVPTVSSLQTKTPTPRELQCLRWTIEGKTAWEVGRILCISEQTVARHVSNATQKLGCANKYQAALRALRMALI